MQMKMQLSSINASEVVPLTNLSVPDISYRRHLPC